MPPKKRKNDPEDDPEFKKIRTDEDPENGSEDGAGDADDAASNIVLEGSLISGDVLYTGGTNWDTLGRKDAPKGVKNRGGRNLWGPHRLPALSGIRVRTVASGCNACHSVVITTEGQAYSWGRNEKGNLGHGDTARRDHPSLIEALKDFNIVDAACGKSHSMVLTDHGHVYSFGANLMGQLGLGHQSPTVPSPTRIKHKGPPIRRLSLGGEFSMIVDVRGNLFSFGLPEYGQLGHNTDGRYFVTSSKMVHAAEMKPRRVQVFIEKTRDGQVLPVTDVEIMDVACGLNHTVALDRKKRVFTWGFGGYGRLGHSEPKDEWVPRLVRGFEGPNRGATTITSGSSFSLAVNEMGMLYLWGQQKPTGEASMYPKPIQDLGGWNIRSIGCCHRSVVVAADDSLVSWGPSPTCGELGYGDNKPRSSAYPQEVKVLNGIYVHKVACGYAHTLLLCRDDTDEDKEKLESMPVFNP